jgi:hypothetical protein
MGLCPAYRGPEMHGAVADLTKRRLFHVVLLNRLAFPSELALPEPTMGQLDSKLVEKLRPPCSKCGRPLILTRTEPGKPGFDRRTYYCAACQDTELVVVPI